MASKQLGDAAEYLTNAAYLMRVRAPRTSAHLMSYRNDLLTDHDLSLSDIQRQQACRACGNIHLPGNGSSVRIDARRVQTKKHRQSVPRNGTVVRGPSKLISCGFCKQDTRTKLDTPGPATRRKSNRAVSNRAKMAAPSDTQKPTPNATSKKRAKNRKAGLQALLSEQKQQQSPSPLSLADFMR